MTFSCNNWKNDDAIVVNAFAKENFFHKRPFRLPLQQRVITLPILQEKKIGMK